MGLLGTQTNSGENGLNYTVSSPGPAAFTICGWLRWFDTFVSFDTPFAMGSSGSETIVFATEGTGKIFTLYCASTAVSGSAILFGKWYFFMISRVSLTDTRLYLDGRLDILNTASANSVTGGISLYHDWVTGSGNQNFRGQLEHVRIWDGVGLTPDEGIQEMFSWDGSPVTRVSQLWAYYKLNTKDDLRDSSGNGRDLVAGNTLTNMTGVPGLLPILPRRPAVIVPAAPFFPFKRRIRIPIYHR